MSKKLPPNCEIEILGRCYKGSRPSFRLHFRNADNAFGDYHSEVYSPAKGQRLKSAAYEICQRYGWLDFPPATGVLTKEELVKLDNLLDDAIDDLDRNPRRYVPDPDKFWRDMFEWSTGEFHSEMAIDGDPPIPSYDSDRDDEWTAYNYGQEFTRVIPRSAKALSAKKYTNGPRGMEIIEFRSGDRDGNWEHEATFCRWQKGVKVTNEDLQRHAANLASMRAAWEAREGLPYGTPELDAANKAYWAAKEAASITEYLQEAEVYEDNWDEDEFLYYAVQLNCYWTLLRYKRYEVWCAIHGKDPLGNVSSEREQVAATFDVTTTMVDGKPVTTAELVEGEPELENEATSYIGGYTVAELRRIVRKNPAGIPLKPERWSSMLNHGWEPLPSPRGSLKMRVHMKGTRTLPLTPHRIRQVSCKGLQEDVLRMLHEIDQRFPK